jgi:hypothetical protein
MKWYFLSIFAFIVVVSSWHFLTYQGGYSDGYADGISRGIAQGMDYGVAGFAFDENGMFEWRWGTDTRQHASQISDQEHEANAKRRKYFYATHRQVSDGWWASTYHWEPVAEAKR